MAFRNKAEHILAFKPDILVVPECEHPDKLKFDSGTTKPNDIFWFGDNKNKVLVFSLIQTISSSFTAIITLN